MKIKLIAPARKPEVGEVLVQMKRRPWDKIHRAEEKERLFFLKKLTAQKGFKIFSDLYQIYYKLGKRNDIVASTPEKIKVLSSIHVIFNKVRI